MCGNPFKSPSAPAPPPPDPSIEEDRKRREEEEELQRRQIEARAQGRRSLRNPLTGSIGVVDRDETNSSLF